MTLQQDLDRRKEEIQQMISGDNLKKAMRRLMDFVRDFSSNAGHLKQVVQFNIKFNALEAKPHDVCEGESAFVFELLDFLDRVEEAVLAQAK